VAELVPLAEVDFFDLRPDWATAIGSPQVVPAKVGNPPSTGLKAALRPPVDRLSLRVDDEAFVGSWLPFLWRPFTCLDQGDGAAFASGPVDLSLRVDDDVHALAVLRVFGPECGWPGVGHCELLGAPPLAEMVVVGRFAVPRVPHADWRGPGIGDRGVGGSSPRGDVAAGRAPAAPRAAGEGCWWVVELVLFGLVVLPAVLGPPTPWASEPEADRPLPLGRLTLGGALSPSSHKDPPSAKPSGPAALS
jgi:hypothetical protein